jgi:hypothetical protein
MAKSAVGTVVFEVGTTHHNVFVVGGIHCVASALTKTLRGFRFEGEVGYF